MKRAPFRFGVVTLAALDLRARPDHAAELLSQLLLGEVVRVLEISRDGRWWRVENQFDLYRGWIRTWGVVGVTTARARAWVQEARGTIRVSYAELRSSRTRGRLVSPLFWRGQLLLGGRRGAALPAELPDGRRGWVDARAVAIDGRPAVRMADRIPELLGVPYLWGGRTPSGIDCSAFCQLVLAEQGVRLPRDADDQHSACARLDRGEEPAPGDLVFFAAPGKRIGHVGITLGGGAYAHARGYVRINSLVRGNPLYDKELAAQVRAFGRPGKHPLGRVRRGRKPAESA